MKGKKLFIVMVGLPARGKSTIANRLKENLSRDSIRTRIFNNGDLRRRLARNDTSHPEFYDPNNLEGVAFREKLAIINLNRSQTYLNKSGQVAIIDATNVSLKRRKMIKNVLKDHTVLFLECINNDNDILAASIKRKISLPEFNHLTQTEAIESFQRRINYYHSIYNPITDENNFVKLDSLNNQIIQELIDNDVPYYDRIRDFLVTDCVKNLFLIRHGETYFNLENRIGGDSELTAKGYKQAESLSTYFTSKKVPIIFTSKKVRTIQTAGPIQHRQNNCVIIPLEEFNEINSGICECMSYEEIREQMPQVSLARKKDKYHYIYPQGEGYISMKKRVDRGIKKALYLTSPTDNIMIIGHRAVNRMILSHFLYRRTEDVPYIYIPQDKFYHIVATQDKKLFQLKPYE